MKQKLFAIIPASLFLAAVHWNLASVNWQSYPLSYVLGSAMIACPFAVLAIAHITIANGRRSHAFLLSGNIFFALAIMLAFFLMRWFQPGWPGVAFFSVVLLCLGATWAVGGFAFRDKQGELKLKTELRR